MVNSRFRVGAWRRGVGGMGKKDKILSCLGKVCDEVSFFACSLSLLCTSRHMSAQDFADRRNSFAEDLELSMPSSQPCTLGEQTAC